MKCKSNDGCRGFSLVELLVVIGIVGALIAILLPTVMYAHSRARSTQCQSNMRQIGIAFVTYASQNQGRVPRCNAFYIPGGNPQWHPHFPSWVAGVGRIMLGRPLTSWDELQRIGAMHCPEHPRRDVPTSYNLNAFSFETQPDWRGSPPMRLDAVKNPSAVPWLMETPDEYIGGSLLSHSVELEHVRTVETPQQLIERLSWIRHRNSSNVLFADGSVRLVDKRGLPLKAYDDGIRNRMWK